MCQLQESLDFQVVINLYFSSLFQWKHIALMHNKNNIWTVWRLIAGKTAKSAENGFSELAEKNELVFFHVIRLYTSETLILCVGIFYVSHLLQQSRESILQRNKIMLQIQNLVSKDPLGFSILIKSLPAFEFNEIPLYSPNKFHFSLSAHFNQIKVIIIQEEKS